MEKPRRRVWGETAVTMVRLHPGAGVPARSPVPKIRRFSGSKGSTSGPTRSHMILALVPSPPRWSSVRRGSVGTRSMFPLVRSTSRSKPVSAYLRITSYNVCYTKLLRRKFLIFPELLQCIEKGRTSRSLVFPS